MSVIGIDITPLQGPHRMRGVGSTAMNVLRHISEEDKANNLFVFYLHDKNKNEALKLIDISSFPNYEIQLVAPARPLPPSIKTVAGLLYTPKRIIDSVLDLRLGSKRIADVNNLDVFLQFEQDITPPPGVKSVIIAYDLIPYVLEKDYLWSYSTARSLHNYSRRGALKSQLKRYAYLNTIKRTMKRASKVIAISKHTKNDFIKHAKVPSEKIKVCHLGISHTAVAIQQKPTEVSRYIKTAWGDIEIKTQLPDTPFLLFIGGADPRRKLADLVYAFNLLRAQGNDIHLVLAGDTMLGPNSIPNPDARHSLLRSSYLDDIYMLGYVNDATREWLYQNAVAFVYPSKYEGFGLPILEALQQGTPVITKNNSSITEISGKHVMFADNFVNIATHTKNQLFLGKEAKRTQAKENINYANNFQWSETAKAILSHSIKY